jgi:hypothetical protein
MKQTEKFLSDKDFSLIEKVSKEHMDEVMEIEDVSSTLSFKAAHAYMTSLMWCIGHSLVWPRTSNWVSMVLDETFKRFNGKIPFLLFFF